MVQLQDQRDKTDLPSTQSLGTRPFKQSLGLLLSAPKLSEELPLARGSVIMCGDTTSSIREEEFGPLTPSLETRLGLDKPPILLQDPPKGSLMLSRKPDNGKGCEQSSERGKELNFGKNLKTPDFSGDAYIPGTLGVKKSRFEPGKYYCTICKDHIEPLYIKAKEDVYVSCEECFMEDIVGLGANLGDAIEEDEKSDDEIVAESAGSLLPSKSDMEEIFGC